MNSIELAECLAMAKRFSALYKSTGLVSVSVDAMGAPRLHLTNSAFMENYGDGEYEFIHNGDYHEMRTVHHGVVVFTLITEDSKPYTKGDRNE